MRTWDGGIEAVLITERLYRRRLRPPDCRGENRAFAALAKEMTRDPRLVPQKLVNTALALCDSGSAGISVLRRLPKGDYLCWNAVAGKFAAHANIVTPREFSPCGTALEISAAQLFHVPGRYYTYLNGLGSPVVELLVAPIHAEDQPLGTLWIATHESDDRQFDAGDLRILVGLAEFAAVALQRVTALETSGRGRREPEGVRITRRPEPPRPAVNVVWPQARATGK